MKRVRIAADVVWAFVKTPEIIASYGNFHTVKAPVPGGRRVSASAEYLWSYNTVVAARLGPDTIAITTRKYSVTTSKLLGKVRSALTQAGYRETDLTQVVDASVPGRWGGFGPAWHATGVEHLPFVVWTRKASIYLPD